jgi:hypothetical protein
MINKEKMIRGEGELVEEDPKIGSRKRTSQSEKMALEEGLSHNEIEFQKTFFSMSEMVKVLYDDYLEQKRPILGEYSKEKSEEGEDTRKTPPSPPSSPSTYSSSSTSSKSTARKHSHKHKHDMPLLKLDVKFELPMYDDEVNAERLDNWVRQMDFIVVCNQSRMRQPKSSWHHFVLQEQHLSGGRVSCKMAHNKWVMYFHHGKILFFHLKRNFVLWVIKRRLQLNGNV